ncbi:MAG: acyl carrier protein [Pseudomonadota bacterium]
MTDTTTLSKDVIVKDTADFIKERFPAFNGVDVDGETPLLDNGEIDSLGILDLMNFLEERFGIEMTDDDFLPDYFESLSTLSELVLSKA